MAPSQPSLIICSPSSTLLFITIIGPLDQSHLRSSSHLSKEMGKIGTKLPSFCLNRIRPHVRVRSPPIQSKQEADVGKTDKCGNVGEGKVKDGGDGAKKPGLVFARKIMIVVDSSIEAKGALQWALSHTVQSQDKLVLLHVTKPSTSKQGLNDYFCSSSLIFLKFREVGFEFNHLLKLQVRNPARI